MTAYSSLIIFVIVATFFWSCSDNNANSDTAHQQTVDSLLSELNKCKQSVVELQQTPSFILTEANRLLETRDTQNAIATYQKLIAKFGNTDEANKAEKAIKEIEELTKKKQQEAEKRAKLGFAGFAQKATFSFGGITFNITSSEAASKWIFDRYDNSYMYTNAERGRTYLVVNLKVSSENKNPYLPPLGVYVLRDTALIRIGEMDYKFSRWSSYGTYLGNNHDFKNDFAYTKTISFTAGYEITNALLNNNTVYIVAINSPCFARTNKEFERPTVAYEGRNCTTPESLTINAINENFVFIKMFGKK